MAKKQVKKKAAVESKAKVFAVERGTFVQLRRAIDPGSKLAIIVSNDVQNEASDLLLAVPLESRQTSLRAPFSVDLGREYGFSEVHTARCDWVTRIRRSDIRAIERPSAPGELLRSIENGLRVALGFDDFISAK